MLGRWIRACSVDSRRHDEEAQVGSQRALHVERKREAGAEGPASSRHQWSELLRSASPEVIEAAWRRLARMYHPDVNHEAEASDARNV